MKLALLREAASEARSEAKSSEPGEVNPEIHEARPAGHAG